MKKNYIYITYNERDEEIIGANKTVEGTAKRTKKRSFSAIPSRSRHILPKVLLLTNYCPDRFRARHHSTGS